MKVPTHLQHKPILVVKEYDKIDSKKYSDAKFLSIGKAQWNNAEISAKVMRYTIGGKWNRQSEELPLHRVLDLANLILSADLQKGGNYVQSTVLKEEIFNEDEFSKIKEYIEGNVCLEERIKELKDTLNKI